MFITPNPTATVSSVSFHLYKKSPRVCSLVQADLEVKHKVFSLKLQLKRFPSPQTGYVLLSATKNTFPALKPFAMAGTLFTAPFR